MNTKRCSRCGQTFTTDKFYRVAHSFSRWCRECHKAKSRQQAKEGYYRKHRRELAELRPPKPVIAKEQKTNQARRTKPVAPPKQYRQKLLPLKMMARTSRKVGIGLFRRFTRELLSKARKRADRSTLTCTITIDFIREKVIEFCACNHYSLDANSPFRPSLDRIDNKFGYTPENVRIVWLIENYARNVFTDQQVIEFCQRKLGIYKPPNKAVAAF